MTGTQSSWIIGAACIAFSAAAQADSIDVFTSIDPTITINGTATGSATAGKNNKGVETTKEELEEAQNYTKRYAGPTQFTADYTINLVNGKFDPTGSTVTFTTVNYTFTNLKSGKSVLKPSDFKTLAIPITNATVVGGVVTSFSFSATNWYPPTAPKGKELINNGLSGTINLANGTSSYTASYINPYTGAAYNYSVTGKFAANPEPATWIMTLTIIAGTAVGAYRRRRRRTDVRAVSTGAAEGMLDLAPRVIPFPLVPRDSPVHGFRGRVHRGSSFGRFGGVATVGNAISSSACPHCASGIRLADGRD
jgi:hypothetical protein